RRRHRGRPDPGHGRRRPGDRHAAGRHDIGVHPDGVAGGAVTAPTRTAVRRRGGPRGFTLIELLITLSVTTIGLIGLLSLHLSVTRGNDGGGRSAGAQPRRARRV